MLNRLFKLSLGFILVGLTHLALAHTYFFGISDLQLNPKTNHIEIIHQLTLHDIDFILKDTLSEEAFSNQKEYELGLKHYIEKRFRLYSGENQLTPQWIGFEISFGQIIIYQEVSETFDKNNLWVENMIIADYFPKQINTLNYKIEKSTGSLTFSSKMEKIALSIK